MSTVETPLVRRRAASPELALWSVLVVLAGAVPGLGLVVGLVLAMTRLRENRTARVVVPILGAVATAVWALGLWGGFGSSGVGPPTGV
jgi:type III secretory pathway component EscS